MKKVKSAKKGAGQNGPGPKGVRQTIVDELRQCYSAFVQAKSVRGDKAKALGVAYGCAIGVHCATGGQTDIDEGIKGYHGVYWDTAIMPKSHAREEEISFP
jgi:hypothetical protein